MKNATKKMDLNKNTHSTAFYKKSDRQLRYVFFYKLWLIGLKKSSALHRKPELTYTSIDAFGFSAQFE